ncbi:MAG: NUDIX domain-containing protein [Planctomycetes bacterium]|nr:NUDIX domain-containing protein [Planctomycetota bacterium]
MHCLRCGTNAFKKVRTNQYFCESCGFTYFQNIAASVAAIIEWNDQILTCVRKYEPGKGMLGLPGGFVDIKETAESALKREIFEEVRITAPAMHYVGSFPNVYRYECVEYQTLVLFFSFQLKEISQMAVGDEIAEIQWITKDEVKFDRFAFDSVEKGLRRYFELKSFEKCHTFSLYNEGKK